ncbi:hypothetical protein V8E53_002855 [Lactarius tabidus]
MDQAMDPNSWECQQRAIDAEINSLEASIRALKHHRNALAPISCLPAEITAAVFFHLGSGQSDIHLVLHVAHVCRRWREVALDHPLFWSHVDFTTISMAGATEMLVRARMAPLYLEANIPSRYWNCAQSLAFKKELLTHISHVVHLSISAGHSQLNKILEGLTSPAPTLEHLSLSVKTILERPPQVSVPDYLFGAIIPRLSSLQLHHYNISWKSPLLKGLTTLEIITMSADARPNLTDWLDALDKMPRLKRLVLVSASPFARRFPFDVERTVTLPFLAVLDISASAVDCGLVLAHLILPALASLCVTTMTNPLNLEKLLPYFVQHACGPQDLEPLKSVLIHSAGVQLGILAWAAPTIDVPQCPWDAKLSARAKLSITSVRNDFRDCLRISEATMAALPLDRIVTLTSPRTDTLDAKFWCDHAPRWPLLKNVHLAPSSWVSLPEHGFGEALLQDDGGRECPLLPLLTYLELIDIELKDSEPRTGWLCEMLMKRVEQGVPLEVLDVRTCAATSLAVQQLSEIVVDVLVPI